MKTFTIKPGDILNKRNTPRGFVSSCSHSGDCQADVESFMNRFVIPNKEYLADYLRDFGAWDDEELKNHEANKMRLLWIASGDIMDQGEFIYSH